MRTEETYRFMDDAATSQTTRMSVQTPMSLMGKEEKEHTIESFAMRPMEIGNFALKSSNIIDEDIFSYDVIKLLQNTNVKGKFDGFRYFRADVEFQVYYNAQPFQQGALLCYYIPYSGDDKSWSQKHSLTSKSACLSESVIFENSEPMVLNIPFNHPHGFVDLVDPQHCDMGQFNLTVYSPLESNIASDTIYITVFAHFKNVKLYGPTDELRHTLGQEPEENDYLVLEPQMAKDKKGKTESAQQEEAGIVTQVSGVVHEVSSALEQVPIVGVVAKPISWVAATVNKIASLFGWSKPISVHTTAMYKFAPSRYMTNYNGVDTSNNMGLDADNQLENYSFFGKGDPLDFNNIITRPNYIGKFKWETKDDSYHKVFSYDVSPTVGWFLEKQQNNLKEDKYEATFARNVTQMNFAAQFFKLWRGNIVFQLKCIKTKFHSGRLLITWRPGDKSNIARPKLPMTYSFVWELAKQNSISFEIPFLNPKPFLYVETPAEKNLPSSPPLAFKNGTLEVYVLNKLVASSDAVVDNVNIIIEACAGKDFAFAIPINPTLYPTALGDIQRIDPDPKFEEQAALDVQPKPPTCSRTFTNLKIKPKDGYLTLHHDVVDDQNDDEEICLQPQIGLETELVPFIPEGTVDVGIEPEKMATGEKIVSFRQLIKRASFFQLAGKQFDDEYLNPALEKIRNFNAYKLNDDYGLASPKSQVLDFDYAHLSYGPPQATGQGKEGKPAIKQKFPFTTDLLTNISSIFAYTRGSIRMKFIGYPAASTSVWKRELASCQLVNSRGRDIKNAAVRRGMSIFSSRAANTIISQESEEVGELQFPHYSDIVYLPKNWASFGQHSKDYGRIAMNTVYGTDQNFVFWRAAGDDFDCAFLMGVPQLQYFDSQNVDK